MASPPMADAPRKRQRHTERIIWKDDMELCLIDGLLSAVENGKRSDNGFKKEVWNDVLLTMRTRFPHGRFEIKQLKSKADQLKKKDTIFQTLRENGGFGWSEEKNISTAPDDVWDKYPAVIIFFSVFYMYYPLSKRLSYRDPAPLSQTSNTVS
jgi:hypothetical protein